MPTIGSVTGSAVFSGMLLTLFLFLDGFVFTSLWARTDVDDDFSSFFC